MHSNLPNEHGIAKRISSILLNQKKPISMDQICLELKDVHMNIEKLHLLISKYEKHFRLFQQPLVKLVTKLGICKTHCIKDTHCFGISPSCSGLHICKFHFLSGECRWGKKCTYGHNLDSDHNKKILRENLMDDITVDDLKYILGLADNRTTSTVPRICKFYNIGNNLCRHTNTGSDCPDLHICKHHVLDACKYGKTCRRNHDLHDDRNKKILCKHGFDISQPQAEIIQELRNVLSFERIDASTTVSNSSSTASLNTGTDIPIMPNPKKEIATASSSETQSVMVRTQQVDTVGIIVPVKTEVIKKEGSAEGEPVGQRSDSPELRVNVTMEVLPFRYLSELKANEKRSKARQTNPDVYDKNCLADVWVENYDGKATIVAHCVDVNEKVHPYHLYGDNCKNGVYVKKDKLKQGVPVKLQGVSVCTPKIADFQSSVKKTTTYLNQNGIHDLEMCEKSVDKNIVYLKVTVILEGNSALSKLTTPLQNKKNLKQKDGNLPQGQKRTTNYPQDRYSKRRKECMQSSDEIRDTTTKPFERFYSRVGTEGQWGNFIDTAGYQESALTWKAQGDAIQSVCMICYPGGTGTGFRVGNGRNCVMTAAHVYDYILQSGHNGVGRRQRNPLKNPDVYAVFGYLKEGELTEKNKFYFKGILHFRNEETDTVILELDEHPNGTAMPPALQYFQEHDCTQEFFFVGHSEGKPLGINKVDKIVNIDSIYAQKDINNIRAMSLKHTQCFEYPDGREYEVQPYHSLNNPHRFLFHCKFTKGASGSPGLVFLNDGRIVVVSMLIRGYPNWYYDPSPKMDNVRSTWLKDSWCVEQGVNLESVHDFMSKQNPRLANEIFCF